MRSVETREELTRQETQIVQLASNCRTNPEIGLQLFISPRPVEWHLPTCSPSWTSVPARNSRPGLTPGPSSCASSRRSLPTGPQRLEAVGVDHQELAGRREPRPGQFRPSERDGDPVAARLVLVDRSPADHSSTLPGGHVIARAECTTAAIDSKNASA